MSSPSEVDSSSLFMERSMKVIVFCLFLLGTSSVCAKEDDVYFRAILATDTNGDGIELSTTRDLEHIKKSIYSIAHQLQIKPVIEVLKGADCCVHNIKKSLRSVGRYSADIVFFYYSGHGNSDPKSRRWPVMYPAGSMYGRGLLGTSVVKFFKKKFSQADHSVDGLLQQIYKWWSLRDSHEGRICDWPKRASPWLTSSFS